jgi:hypothetical protein
MDIVPALIAIVNIIIAVLLAIVGFFLKGFHADFIEIKKAVYSIRDKIMEEVHLQKLAIVQMQSKVEALTVQANKLEGEVERIKHSHVAKTQSRKGCQHHE